MAILRIIFRMTGSRCEKARSNSRRNPWPASPANNCAFRFSNATLTSNALTSWFVAGYVLLEQDAHGLNRRNDHTIASPHTNQSDAVGVGDHDFGVVIHAQVIEQFQCGDTHGWHFCNSLVENRLTAEHQSSRGAMWSKRPAAIILDRREASNDRLKSNLMATTTNSSLLDGNN